MGTQRYNMHLKLKSLNQLSLLREFSQQWDESIDLLTVTGTLTSKSLEVLLAILQAFNADKIEEPSLLIDGQSEDSDALQNLLNSSQTFSQEWTLNLNKSRLLINDTDKLFILKDAFISWANQLTPTRTLGCDFNKPLTIYIKDLSEAFGGGTLKFIPADSEEAVFTDESNVTLPSEAQVRSIVRITSGNYIHLNPSSIALTWGNRDQPEAMPFKRFFMAVLVLCFAQEVYVRNDELRVTLRGTKNLDSNLTSNWEFDISTQTLDDTVAAVSWMFQERVETRQKLLTDRLSLDITSSSPFVNGVSEHINHALNQAKERYGFVILDRKDAYLKELKDVMKDVRTQSDLYANKVRDLVSTLLRDVLAVLFLVGVSLIAKLNTTEVINSVNNTQLFIFFKVLAIYFLISITLQAVSHWRDVSLAKSECERWLQLTHDYLTKEVVDDNFTRPLNKRRNMFYLFASISIIIYFCLACLSWNAELVAKFFSGHPTDLKIESSIIRHTSVEADKALTPTHSKMQSLKGSETKLPK